MKWCNKGDFTYYGIKGEYMFIIEKLSPKEPWRIRRINDDHCLGMVIGLQFEEKEGAMSFVEEEC